MADIVERYLRAVASHDWDVVDDCIADDIVRVGPFGDRYAGRAEYLAFITDLMPKLKGHSMPLGQCAGPGVGGRRQVQAHRPRRG
jgi:hypothetical protein